MHDAEARANDPLAPATLIYTDADGIGQVSASVGRVPLPLPPQLSPCPDLSEHPFSRCTLTHLDDGATLIFDESPADETRPSVGRRLTAVRTDRNGGMVAVSASNTRDNRNSSPSRPTPPLNARQLTDIAVSTAWKPVLAAVPAPPRGSVSPPSFQSLPAAKVTEVITQNLPGHLRTADRGGTPGYGHLTVDDGRGKCLVAVTVQQWEPDDEALTRVFRGATRRADGVRVKVTRSHPEKGGEGAVLWSVDIWHPDGLRVAVNELNAKAYRLPGTRSEPALGIDELKTIALSDAWRTALAGAHRPGRS
ncbi:hypothetical protein [Streptomyces sp. NPDC002825]|uniref:hypothetical protein n=1 Tax=Streptomyces sp. NPDC002825 TaxID=3154666 RepID=UPI0033207412